MSGPHPYDFFMIVCGPIPLSDRVARPEEALAIATGDATAREWAWKRLETADPGPAGCRRIRRNGTVCSPPGLKAEVPPHLTVVRGSGPAGWLWPPL